MPAVPPLAKRQARYERIVALRDSTTPPMAYSAIGAQMTPVLTGTRVKQILDAGKPVRAGRPNRPDKRAILTSKVQFWEKRLANARRRAAGESADPKAWARISAEIEGRIDALTTALAKLAP